MQNQAYGVNKRQTIYTSQPNIDETNVLDVLRKALPKHEINAAQMKFLYGFEDGNQPLNRVKTYRPTIDCQCVDNVAHEVTKFHVGYEFGNPITLIQRGEKDSGSTEEPTAISLLNEQYETLGIKSITQKLGKDIVITNLGYTYVGVNMDYEDGDNLFNVVCLNPLTTFVIKSSYYIDHRDMMAVTYRVDDKQVRHFTCYTRSARFEISQDKIEYQEMNPFNQIPIVEWFGNYDGMGVWEHEIDEMNNLNLMISDFSNTVEQNMQAIWHANDVDFPKQEITKEDGTTEEVVVKPKNGEWLNTFTTQDGKTPFVEALSINYDYGNMLNNIASRRSLILQKCYVPLHSEGDNMTGVAASALSGWDATEVAAMSQQNIIEGCKMKEVRLVLKAIKLSPYTPVDSPLLDLKPKDLQPNIKRQKTYEMSTKANTLATLIKNGIDGQTAIKTVNLFDDANQVYADSKELIDKYQKSLFEGSANTENSDGRIMQDLSDQEDNSPFVGATS